ncbi:MAG: ATP-grasp domain-containing protein, partial [Gammaproteobacteria bacterium]|nr:ATP-grasp domain-containing protein [Gammaproteobacteria bacterium]
MRVGIVGGGQLARMLALAGIPLGLHFVFLDPAKDACAAELGEHLCGDYDDERLLAQMAERCDVVTYEFENVPETSIEFLSARVPVFPDARALATARDRLNEKSLFRELDIDTVPFVPVDSLSTLQQAVTTTDLPAVLKTRTMGYDGKGQAVLREET